MKEQFIDIGILRSQTSPLNDMDLQYYLSSFSSSNTFRISDVQDVINYVKLGKKDDVYEILNSKEKNDVRNTATNIDSILANKLEVLEKNSSIAGRQNEINEWSNFNKLDTLYFMQILFICITFITLMMFLKVRGFILESHFILFSIIAGLVATITLIIRARYTNVVRDNRYWHKARFPSVRNPYPTPKSSVCDT